MNASQKLKVSLENLERAHAQLQQFIVESTGRRIEKAGIIQAFEFTYEAFWHMFQKIADANGTPAPLPRLAMAAAFQLGLLQDEAIWLRMIKDRNLTSHVYNEKTANAIHDAVVQVYAPEMALVIDRVRRFLEGMPS